MLTTENFWDPLISTEMVEHILLFKLFDSINKDGIDAHQADMFKINAGDMESLMAFDLSDELEQHALPENNPLIDIICKHTRIVKYKKGDIIIKEGDFGNSAFYIASGKVAVILPPGLPDEQLGHLTEKKKSLLQTVQQLWQNHSYSEQEIPREQIQSQRPSVSVNEGRLRLENIAETLEQHEYTELNSGEMFGEIGALGRTPRTTTVVAEIYCELLEIRWQGLRDLRLLSQEFRQSLDRLYRNNSLLVHLYSLPLFAPLSKSAIQLIAEDTVFKTYGSFEWQTDYKKNLQNDSLHLLKSETLIVAEGEHSDSIYLVRSGFARVSHQYNNGYQVMQYLGQGDCFGLETIIYNWKNKASLPMQTSLHALGYADILQIPTYIIERMVLPSMKEEELSKHLGSELLQQFAEKSSGLPVKELNLNDAVLDFMSDYRFINGTSTMLIDTDRCTRCDDCVTACAVGHNNNPRFNRHGFRYDHFMIANACMHCNDPVCMIECPTGAIQRKALAGEIIINDTICIGCSNCANSCPYENIRMVETRDKKGMVIRDLQTHKPVLKATKCNLCIDQLGGPACERACPHDALKRVDIQDLPTMTQWMNR